MSIEIIVPGRFIEPSDPVSLSASLEGWFTLSAIKNGEVVRSHRFKEGKTTTPFKNLILNQGLDRLGDATGPYRFFMVGTGTTPPDVVNTELVDPVGGSVQGSRVAQTAGVLPDYYYTETIQGTSSIGQFGNSNLTEIRVGGQSTGEAYSRALIVDSVGNPTAFPISDEEQLQMSYELRLYPPLTDANFTVDVSGSRDCVVRALGVNSTQYWRMPQPQSGGSMYGQASGSQMYVGGLGALTDATPQGGIVSGNPVPQVSAYVPGSYKRHTRFMWGTTLANSPSMETHRVLFGCSLFQVSYDPPLAKTNEQTMFLDYELSWARR